MPWKCKYCPAICEKRAQFFKHYRLKHGTYARTDPFPCLHQECMCTFKSMLRVAMTHLLTQTFNHCAVPKTPMYSFLIRLTHLQQIQIAYTQLASCYKPACSVAQETQTEQHLSLTLWFVKYLFLSVIFDLFYFGLEMASSPTLSFSF